MGESLVASWKRGVVEGREGGVGDGFSVKQKNSLLRTRMGIKAREGDCSHPPSASKKQCVWICVYETVWEIKGGGDCTEFEHAQLLFFGGMCDKCILKRFHDELQSSRLNSEVWVEGERMRRRRRRGPIQNSWREEKEVGGRGREGWS